jgi:hypothetical protein
MTADQTRIKKTRKSEQVRKSSRHDEDSSHVIEVGGLCVNCDLAENCMHRKAGSSAVHFCEEFTESGNAPIHKYRKVSPQISTEREIVDQSGLKGLCINCEHRNNCAHAAAVGGVWHCEEYR